MTECVPTTQNNEVFACRSRVYLYPSMNAVGVGKVGWSTVTKRHETTSISAPKLPARYHAYIKAWSRGASRSLTMARKILYSEPAWSTMRVRDRSGTAA